MFDIDLNNKIILTNSYNKEYLIRKLSSYHKLVNVKILDINEFIEEYYFKFDEETIFYLMNKYNIKYDIARTYIKNMYYIDESSDNAKINLIYKYKKELIDNKLLYVNNNFKKYLNNKKVIIYNIPILPKLISNVICNYEVINKYNDYQHEIYEFKNIDEEVTWIATQIIELVNKGVDINKIYLTNLNDEYRIVINRIFKIFNIPFNINIKRSIYTTKLCSKFIANYKSNIEDTLNELKQDINDKQLAIFNKIINICNKYGFIDDYLKVKEMIINDLKDTNIDNIKKTNSVKEASLYRKYDNDEHIFLLGFNQGQIPVIYKDEDYLTDKEYELLNMETSIDRNINIKEETINCIKDIDNLYITYKLKTLNDIYIISNINEQLNYPIMIADIKYNYSNLYNKLQLAKYLDLFNKYNVININLPVLLNNYNMDYKTYDNKFNGIDKDDLYKFLDNKLLLSYSSLDNYNRCGFRYYLNNILKINEYEDSFMQLIGNLFHYVLSCAFLENFNFEECFDNYIKKTLNHKETFFIKKLKNELKFIIDTINNHNKYTKLSNELYEEKVYVNLDGNIKVTFMGVIDKLKYTEDGNKQLVAVIDYKTGNPNLNLNNVIYGIEMQLPIYVYLAKNHPKFNNIEIAGFYLQKILNNEIVAQKNITYEEQKRKNLLLQGYSTNNIKLLEKFDSTYIDSKVIRSLKTSSKGFYAYSKVLDNDTIEKLTNMAEKKIKETVKNILDGNFDINPKLIGDKNLGCEFCTFKDICYRKEKDINRLKEYKKLEFLGGDGIGMD